MLPAAPVSTIFMIVNWLIIECLLKNYTKKLVKYLEG